jgi:hypothetical protein
MNGTKLSKVRRTIGTLIIAAAMFATAAAQPMAMLAASWQLYQVDADRFYDVAFMDANANGYGEDIWYDLDNDGRWDTRLYNTYGGDSFSETVDYDFDEDGTKEFRLVDTNQRAGFEWAYINRNDDGNWDGPAVWIGAQPTASSGGSALDINFSTTEVRDFYIPPCLLSAAIRC